MIDMRNAWAPAPEAAREMTIRDEVENKKHVSNSFAIEINSGMDRKVSTLSMRGRNFA
jgi:hypothetical protein